MNSFTVVYGVRRSALGLLAATIVLALTTSIPDAQASERNNTYADIRADLRVRTPAFALDAGGVSVPGYAWNATPGAPRLPVHGIVVELPPIGEWSLEFASTGVQVLPERISIPAVPAPSLPEVNGATTPGFPGELILSDRPDPAIYESDAFYPATPVVAGTEQWQRGRRLLAVQVFPFQYNPVTRQLRYNPDLTVRVRTAAISFVQPPRARTQPVTQPAGEIAAARVRTTERGMHAISFSQLDVAGIPVATVDPANCYMTVGVEAIAIQVTGGEDHRFDPGDLVVFYAEPYIGRWMSHNVYRFACRETMAPVETRMANRTVQSAPLESISTITDTLHIERDRGYYYDYVLPTETDHFFDDQLYASASTSTTNLYDFTPDDPILDSGVVAVTALLYGGRTQAANPDQSVEIKLNATSLVLFQWNDRTPYTAAGEVAASALVAGANRLYLTAALSQLTGVSDYTVYPDWIDIDYPALADAEGDRMEIPGIRTTATAVDVSVTGFSTGGVRVYDVRDARHPVQLLTTSFVQGATGDELHFWDEWVPGAASPRYSLSTSDSLIAPAVEADEPSAWKTDAHDADYIAIVPDVLWSAIDPLLQRRADQGLRIAKVSLRDIYDEFNNSQLHPRAIRDFLAYAYQNWNHGGSPPQFVLLAGDGHFDFKGVTGSPLPNLVPPFLLNIDPWIVETASDNRYVSVDGPDDYLPDMAVGRLPVSDATQLRDVIAKIAAYEDGAGPDEPWQNRVVFVADDKDNAAGNFHEMSELARLGVLPSYYESPTLYYRQDATVDTAAEMKTAIKQSFNDSALVLQWFGHASRFRWGSVSGIWNVFDSKTLNANTRLPFTLAYSCWAGYFINMAKLVNSLNPSEYTYQSLGEAHLLEPGRGSIADLSPSGQHVGSALTILDEGLTRAMFRDRISPVGQSVDAAKLYYFANSTAWHDVIDTSVLFGDPALRLRLPLPPAEPPPVTLTPGAVAPGQPASLELNWPHLAANTSYGVWRGEDPYFDPPLASVQAGSIDASSGYAPGDEVRFTDAGTVPPPAVPVLGDPQHNYFWVVRGINWRGASSASNRVGEFDFALIAGQR